MFSATHGCAPCAPTHHRKSNPSSPLLQPNHFTARNRVRISASAVDVRPEAEVDHMPAFLDSLKWDVNGLVVAIAQHVDTGEVLMQAFADRNAVNETMQTG